MNDKENCAVFQTAEVGREAARAYFSRIGIALVILRTVTSALQYLLTALFAYNLPQIYNSWWFIWLLSTIPLYFVACPLFIKALPPTLCKANEKSKLGFGRGTVICIVSGAAIFIFNLVGSSFAELIRIVSNGRLSDANTLNSIVNDSPVWATVFFCCVAAPIAEELIFRKALCDRTKPFGELQSCLFSGLFFGMFHGNFRQFFYAAALGTIFAFVYVKTNNIIYTIALHSGINLFGSVIIPNLLSNENLEKLAGIDGASGIDSETIALLAAVMILAFLIFAVVVGGIALFIIFARKIRFAPKRIFVERIGSAVYGNLGVVSAIIMMGVTFILSLI